MDTKKLSISLFFGFNIIFSSLCISQAHFKLAPALYAFGDSNVDSGNNNLLNVFAKSNYPPYGVDFPCGATGRPTNGYNFADFFAKWLGLNLPPAIRLVNTSDYSVIKDGINYASSSAGILSETATKIFKGILSLEAQIDLFNKTVEENLAPQFECKDRLKEHLSKSIFLVVMGANDYRFTFDKKINSTNPFDYQTSADLLAQKLSDRLEDLYNLGARKFVVFEIAALGCEPSMVTQYKPKNTKCVEHINAQVLLYNIQLPRKLGDLQSKLPGSIFVIGKFFDFTLSLVQYPGIFGLKDVVNPCCETLVFGPCDPTKPPCKDRDSHVYFDAFHITQASYKILANNCFNGIGSCFPINIRQLALL